ncbi:MAG: flagellar motor switch protein FliG [SAR86 cluster bacterium]|jgi:flagellar motor switch protein FliG|nr:flagellar motor switch protein FliG [Pseudomonadales bacterium]|tara:strand:+ start:736 stop:1806 length:1071 start_codon:yes stop_codon:yes gene_type:complete
MAAAKPTNNGKEKESEGLSDAVKAELETLTATERAAVIMLLLGEQQAADCIRYLSPREVQSLGACMVSVVDLSQEAVNVVLDDFLSTIKKQTSLGLGTIDYVENILKKALGEDKAATVLGRIMPGATSKGLEILRWMDARSIGEMVQAEHPQVVAIILSVLEYDVAADVLNFVPEGSRAEILQRIALLDTVQPSAMDELEQVMRKQFSNSSSAKSSSFGGIKAAAKIMNFTKVDMEGKLLEGVTAIDAELALKIQDNMFTFSNLSALENRSIQVLMRNVDSDELMVALKGADELVKDKFMDNMSQRAKVMFLDEMEAKGPIRITDVEEAQKTIMRLARKLSDAGELVLSGRGDDFV